MLLHDVTNANSSKYARDRIFIFTNLQRVTGLDRGATFLKNSRENSRDSLANESILPPAPKSDRLALPFVVRSCGIPKDPRRKLSCREWLGLSVLVFRTILPNEESAVSMYSWMRRTTSFIDNCSITMLDVMAWASRLTV
jgi:hypothetical protein